MSPMMTAVRYHEYGDSKKLQLESVERPTPKENEILVKVAFSGVNPVDWKIRSGWLKDFVPVAFPSIPGAEFSGVVEAVGPRVKSLKKGQRVFGQSMATYAQYLVASERDVALVPDTVSLENAATVPMGALTAWHLVEAARIQPGQTVVVLGAAGGVGLFVVQFAKTKGAKVYGVASTANQPFVKSLGAEAIDHTAGPVASHIQDIDVVLDTAGGGALEGAYSLVRKGGHLLTVAGMVSEEKAKVQGITARGVNNLGTGPLPEIQSLLAMGKLVTTVGKIFPLRDAAAAQDLNASGHGRGRILLKI